MFDFSREIPKALERSLRNTGFDLLHWFRPQAYNDAVEGHDRLGPLSVNGKTACTGLLIGNSAALWGPLLVARGTSAELQASADPLDHWVEQAVGTLARELGDSVSVRYAHDTGERLVSMLHLAEASGLARVGPAHLAVHPVFGPWFGLRAVLLFEEDVASPSPVSSFPCEGCPAPCTPVFEAALAATGTGRVEAAWTHWLAVRDACPVGRDHRYGENQIRYHYTKDWTALEPDR